jgi:phytoene synthase
MEVMADLSLTTRETLKQADPDRYRAALMADAQRRHDLLILYAFHYELSKVPDVTSEPMVGQIRYQWWREAIDEIYSDGEVRRHEISTPLTELLRRTDVPRFWIDRLIDGRARDLDPQPFADLAEAQSYARQTSGQLMQIAVKLIGGEPDEAVLKAGEAWGLTGLARAYGYYHDRILQNLTFPALLEHTREVYGSAQVGVEANVFPAIAYAALIPKFLDRMGRSGFDPVKDKVAYGPLAKQFRLMTAGLRGQI